MTDQGDPDGPGPRWSGRRVVVPLVVAGLCLAVVATVVVGGVGGSGRDAVDELPSAAEVAAAQAHGHGRRPASPLPIETQTGAPTSTLAPFDRLVEQLDAVARVDGVGAALDLLTLVTTTDPQAAAMCADAYRHLVESAPSTAQVPDLGVVCVSP